MSFWRCIQSTNNNENKCGVPVLKGLRFPPSIPVCCSPPSTSHTFISFTREDSWDFDLFTHGRRHLLVWKETWWRWGNMTVAYREHQWHQFVYMERLLSRPATTTSSSQWRHQVAASSSSSCDLFCFIYIACRSSVLLVLSSGTFAICRRREGTTQGTSIFIINCQRGIYVSVHKL